MANDKDFILKNAIEIGGSTKVTIGDAPASGSVTIGGDLANASYDGIQFDVSARETSPNGVEFKTDGTKMYIAGAAGDDITEYTLSPAWDITSATYVTDYPVSGQQVNPRCVRFKSDGTAMYVSNSSNASITTYTLSTPWSISSVTSNSTTTLSGGASTIEFWFKSDGTRIFGLSNTSVFSYTLSTPWLVSSASADTGTLTVPSGHSIALLSDGTKLYTSQETGSAGIIHEFVMTTPYDLSTGSASGVTFDASAQDIRPYGITLKPDDTKLFIVGNNDDVSQYNIGSTVATATFDTSTGNYFTHTPSADSEYGFSNAGDVQTFQLEVTGAVNGYDLSGAAYDSVSFSVSGQDTSPLDLTFNNDGTKMYIVGSANDRLYQYSLSTAYDLSTASYDSVSFSVSSQDTGPSDMIFNNDGTKMYVVGFINDAIYQYSLSTAYALNTASYDSVSLSLGAQDSFPAGVAFNNNGTKMYIVGGGNDAIYQYSLSTAFDLSTASYDSVSLSISGQDTNPRGIVFNSTGTKMYMVGISSLSVHQYSLSTAFDLSTASYDSVSFSVSSQDNTPSGMAFNTDGTKMYVVGFGNDNVYQYSTGSAITITWDADIQWAGGTAPDSPAANEKDIYTITTDDGGTTYVGVQSGDNFS